MGWTRHLAATAVFCWTVVSVVWPGILLADAKRVMSYPELYYANVAGKSVVVVVDEGDKTPCHKRSFVDRRYRQIDGRCNHPRDWGAAHEPVKRYMRAHYQDRYGHNTPRIYSTDGSFLKSPREISWKISPDQSRRDHHTMLVLQIGQLVDHDITSAPVPTETNSSLICCGIPLKQMPRECFPIPIPPGDPAFKTNCMEFVRSEPDKDKSGRIKYPREQMNALTSFLDASAVYGSNEETFLSLRTNDGRGALLKTEIVNGRERLPRGDSHTCELDLTVSTGQRPVHSYCQLSGDMRVNEQPCLGAIHTVFHLEHNRIVRMLTEAILRKRGEEPTKRRVRNFIENSPLYTQEKLFQESKKILGGLWQKIVYCDWLPIVLGSRLYKKFKLGCDRPSKYNPYVDPRVSNAFLGAAFRFGHTLIPNKLNIDGRQIELRTQFNIPNNSILHYESIVEGLTEDRSQETFDRFLSSSVTNHLFETDPNRRPLDLMSLNIQRGRDHGLPGYYYWRLYYRLKRVRNFSNFGRDTAALMRTLYRDVRDIDLFVGGILEPPVPDGIVGETFGHIIANQFADLKFGDSHFFLSKEVPQGFTEEQRTALLRTDIKTMICAQNLMTKIQDNPFYSSSRRNRFVWCDDVPPLDLTPFTIYW